MGAVRGTVTLDGKPLTTGWVHSHPQSGRGARGAIQSDGSFELVTNDYGKGAIVGEHRLTIIAQDSASATDAEDADVKLLVPLKYTQPGTSRLSVVVEPGQEQIIDLSLKSTT